jgi:hypothetical protein
VLIYSRTDDVFWMEAYGDKVEFFKRIDNKYAEGFARINYGPWDRLNNNVPFIPGFGAKLPGAQFYPADMTVAEFEAWDNPGKRGIKGTVFRSCRFGASDAHGKANMLCMKYFADNGAFLYQDNGCYKVNFEEMKKAVESLMAKIVTMQGNCDYEGVKAWMESDGVMTESLRKDLDRVNAAGVPVDIFFKQGKEVLGL